MTIAELQAILSTFEPTLEVVYRKDGEYGSELISPCGCGSCMIVSIAYQSDPGGLWTEHPNDQGTNTIREKRVLLL